MIDNTNIQRIKRETLAMKSVNDWLNQVEKIGNKRSNMGMSNPQFGPMQQPQSETMSDKYIKLLEKKQEMEMMSEMMGNFVGSKGNKVEEKKESPQSKFLGAIASLMASDPEKATKVLENLDEKQLAKLAMLNDPDPNAALMRSMLENKDTKTESNSMLDMLNVFKTLNQINAEQKPKEDTTQKVMLEIMKMTFAQNQQKSPSGPSEMTVMMQEMMRSEREQRLASQQQMAVAQQENNNLMMRYLQEKNNELHSRPSAADEFTHMLGAIGAVKEGFGTVMGGPVTDKEMRKMEMEQDKWRFEKELERDQRNTMLSMISGIGDKIAEAATGPVGEELRNQFANRAKDVGTQLETLNVDQQPQPVSQDPLVEHVNDEIIPQTLGKRNFNVYGEGSK